MRKTDEASMNVTVTRRKFLWAAASAAVPAVWAGAARSDAAAERPNIVFLMDDQHRWDALGCIDPAVITPNLDKLARHGILFDQAVCQAPMCVPSRNSMMFGLYPNQLGVLRNGRGIQDSSLPARPLAAVLKAAGYQTAGFGKAHWGLACSTRGFETRYIAECLEQGAVMMKHDQPEAKAQYDAEGKTMGGGEENNLGYLGFTSKVPEKNHRDGWVTGKCLEFIENKIDPARPLFLYLSFLKPHAGHNVPAGYEAQYDLESVKYAQQPPWKKDISAHALGINRREMYIMYWREATDEQWRQMTMRYRANCTWIDDMFGRALGALKRKGVLDNALIVYCSDHGEMLGERFYRFNKYCLYESSVRVPLILSGSAVPLTLRGQSDHRPAELVDLYPTILKAAGIKIPGHPVGLNLLGQEKRQGSFCALHERRDEAAFMWRTPHYKLILRMKRNADDAASQYSRDDIIGGEFYDLRRDPQEWHDLYCDEEADQAQIGAMTETLLVALRKQQKLI